jgi:tetratricopeptide (TPR) repeat protein
MRTIKLSSGERTIAGKWGRSGVIFLVWSDGNYSFVQHPAAGQHSVAAFCRQDKEVAAIKMNGSVSFGSGGEQCKWLKGGEGVHVGLETYQIGFEGKKLGLRKGLKLLAAGAAAFAVLSVIISVMAWKKQPARQGPVVDQSTADSRRLPASGSAAGPLVTDPRPSAQDLQTEWQVTKLITDAKRFRDSGDTAQARMSLEQVITIAPGNDEANALLTALDPPRQDANSQAMNEFIERAEVMIRQGEEAMNASDHKGARESFLKAAELFKNAKVKPALVGRIEDGIKRSEAALSEELRPALEQASKLMDASDPAGLKGAVEVIRRDILKSWPDHPAGVELLGRAYEGLNKLALQYVMKGDTLRQLSGCREAVVQYKAALATAVFPEVPAYQRAEVGAGQCQ